MLPAGSSELSEEGARPKDARAAEDFYVRTFAEPTFEVTGIQSGSPMLPRTVIPVEAIAKVSLRLAPGQKVEEITPVVERLLREAAPNGAELQVELLSTAEPGLVSPDEKAIQLGLDAFERVLGARPALIRTGGTLPIVPALSANGIPTVITGFGLPDSQTHSPNERLVAEYVPLGIATARELFVAFAELGSADSCAHVAAQSIQTGSTKTPSPPSGRSEPMAISSRPSSPASNARTVAGLTRTTSQQRSSRISSSSLTCPVPLMTT
jgi:hypothetical protein